MRKILFLVLFFLIVPSVNADTGLYWRVTNFDAEIQINNDYSIDVIETIDFDFGDEEGHGIYRYIPYKYTLEGDEFKLELSDVSIKDESGSKYDYEKTSSGAYVEYKVGDADIEIAGEHTYVISYSVGCGYNYIGEEHIKCPITLFDDKAELYWNVTGNDWEVPIDNVDVSIYFPETFSDDEVRASCYYGPYGSEDECPGYLMSTKDIEGVTFNQYDLESYEGLSAAVNFPKNNLVKPSAWGMLIKEIWPLILPVIVFAIMFVVWQKHGRDPKGRGVVVAQFDAPDNLSPAEVGTLIDQNASNKDISSEIIQLAVMGYLKINRIEEKKLLGKKKDYRLDKLKEADDKLNAIQKKLLMALFYERGKNTLKEAMNEVKNMFKGKPKDSQIIEEHYKKGALASVKISDLKDKFYTDMPVIVQKTYGSLVDKGHIPKNPQIVITIYVVLGIILGIGGVIFFGVTEKGFGIVAAILSALIVIIFGIFMPKRTKKGALTKEHILGLKEYLRVAEKDRIKFHNAPAKDPKQFEKLLPYAMVLGVEKEWAKQFEDMYKGQPDWYNDPSGARFNTVLFASSMRSFANASTRTLSSTPQSASGGSGVGGGFSGGGFGGGGGGGW